MQARHNNYIITITEARHSLKGGERRPLMKEDKIYEAIRARYGYSSEGDELVDYLADAILALERGDK